MTSDADEYKVYKYMSRRTYDPGRCTTCDHPLVADWHNVSTYTNPDAWLPGLVWCLNPDCLDRGIRR